MECLIDGHCHYTGSLSDDFFQPKNDNAEYLLHLTSKKNWYENYNKYFEIYNKRQKLCKYTTPETTKESYRLGAIDIASSYFKEGVSQFQLRVGPKLNIVETKNRLTSMNEGFNFIENKYKLNNFAKIILTFIQDKEGHFTNYSDEVLDYLFKEIYDRKELTQRVVGFDFSGPEYSRDWKSIQAIIKKINEFNASLKSNNRISLEVMAHAGELIDLKKYEETFEQIIKLIDLKINRISHGTVLWIPSVYVDEQNYEKIERDQTKILKLISSSKTVLEICPSGNFLLSPMESINQIPLNKFDKLGVFFTINTDSKGIYKTTLKKEYTMIRK